MVSDERKGKGRWAYEKRREEGAVAEGETSG